MADQVPVVPADVQQLQDALAVPPAQAGAAQDAQNIDGGDPPAAVAQVAVPAAQPAHQPHADVVSRSCLSFACFAFFLLLGLSRLCSATFEQLLAFGATFCGFSNLEQVLPFRAIFEQNIGLEHISSTKKSTISWKTSIHANFLKAYHVINLLNT